MSDFGMLDMEEVAGEDQRLQTKPGGSFMAQFVPVYEMKTGEQMTLRILPPTKGGKLFQYNRLHTINGRKVPCPRPLVNGKWDREVACPICDQYNSYWRQVDKLIDAGHSEESPEVKALQNKARAIKPAERYYYNALIRKWTIDGEMRENVGPRILSVGKTVHQMIIRAIVSEDPSEKTGNVTDVKAGYDFILKKGDKGGYPNYDRSVFARDKSPLGDAELVKRVSEGMLDLSKFRVVKPLEDLKKELAIYRGVIPDDVEEFDGEKFDAEFADYGESNGHGASHSHAPRKTQVSVPAKVEDATQEVVEAATQQDAPIESPEFLADLAEFQAEG